MFTQVLLDSGFKESTTPSGTRAATCSFVITPRVQDSTRVANTVACMAALTSRDFAGCGLGNRHRHAEQLLVDLNTPDVLAGRDIPVAAMYRAKSTHARYTLTADEPQRLQPRLIASGIHLTRSAALRVGPNLTFGQ
jgi:hypothetical protein